MRYPTPISRKISAILVLAGLPTVGYATVNSISDAPWISGSVQPLIEPSHLFALVMLGAVSAILGRRARWALPLMFVALLGFGIILGTEGAIVPMADTIVLTTALGMALLLLDNVRIAFAAITTIAGAFALFHGVADGADMIIVHADAGYLAGFAAGNVVILFAGIVVGDWARRRRITWTEYLRHELERFHGFKFGS